MTRTLSILLLAAIAASPAPLRAQTTPADTAVLSTEIPSVADSLRRAVPGTRVRLAPPPAFTPADRFSGFQDASTGASIMIIEVPGPFDQVTAGFTAQRMAPQGIELRALAPLRVAGQPAKLLFARQTAGGVRYEKQVLAFGHDSASVVITANYPESAAARLREPMRRAVLSAAWSSGAAVDLDGGLPFEVTGTPGLKRAARLSNSLLFTESGEFPVRAPGEAIVIVAVSFRPSDLSDLAEFSRARLRQQPELRNPSFRSGAEVQTGGGAGYELIADARMAEADLPLVVYQVVIPDGNAYTILQAQVAADRAERFLPQFRQMARTLRPRPASAP